MSSQRRGSELLNLLIDDDRAHDTRWRCMLNENDTKCLFLSRILMVVLSYCALLSSRFLGLISNTQVECMEDKIFQSTQFANDYFNSHREASNILMIASNECIDFFTLVLIVSFICYNIKFRLLITFALFYALRALVQLLFIMRPPVGYIWGDPGFPSIMVPTGKTTDFFFSGHVGYCLISALEFNSLKWRRMQIFCILCTLFESCVMIVFRGHYSIDLIAGLIFAHWSFIMSTRLNEILEGKVIPRIARYCHNRRLKFKKCDPAYAEYRQLQREEFGTSPSSSDKN